MDTTPGPENPFGYTRYGYAWEHVAAGGAAHLDFGCGDGCFLDQLSRKNIAELTGVDVDREAVKGAEAESGGRYQVLHIDGTSRLPFADRAFTSITLLDVLEHVNDQRSLLKELHRVLGDDGVLILTVPGRHLFSCLDMGNLKFRFPRLHRWYYCRGHSHADYERRYVTHPDGLIGDVSAAKRWHEHFTPKKLNDLLTESGFSIVQFDGAGYFVRLIKILALMVGSSRRARTTTERLIAADARRFKSANLFCMAKKTG